MNQIYTIFCIFPLKCGFEISLENKLLLISINFTPKTSHSCLKKWYTMFSRSFELSYLRASPRRPLHRQVWSRKAEGRFPEAKELKQRVRDVLVPLHPPLVGYRWFGWFGVKGVCSEVMDTGNLKEVSFFFC